MHDAKHLCVSIAIDQNETSMHIEISTYLVCRQIRIEKFNEAKGPLAMVICTEHFSLGCKLRPGKVDPVLAVGVSSSNPNHQNEKH